MRPEQTRAPDRRVPIALGMLCAVLSLIGVQSLAQSAASLSIMFAAAVQAGG